MARNQQYGSGSWNDNDRIMRRDDDRTRQSREWGSQSNDRNSYRTDDYPTDKEMYRAGDERYDRDMAYGHYGNRNNQMHGQSNYNMPGAPQTFSSDRDRDYGWSSDYRTSGDYRPSYDRDSSSFSSQRNSLRGGSFGSSGYGSGSGSGYSSSGYSSDFRSSAADNRSGTNYTSDGFGGYYGTGFGMGYGSGFGMGSSSSGTQMGSQQQQGLHYGKGPKNYRRSDERIKEDVSDALERNAQIDASEIELDVKDGVVTMRGHVEDRRTKRMAEDMIENMYGVKDIRNELVVDQSIFTQARNAIFGESVESQSASQTNSNKSTAMKSKH